MLVCVGRPPCGGGRAAAALWARCRVDDRNQKIDIMPPPEPSMLSYSKAILDLWGEKDEEATRVWMGERQQTEGPKELTLLWMRLDASDVLGSSASL